VLLEPLQELTVRTPDEYLGDVMGDVSARRGQILGTEASPDGRGTVVHAVIPEAELHLYATELSSMTHGRASFTTRYRGYEEMPAEAAQKVAAESSKDEVLAEA
jgi:elongation factor G